MKKIVLAALLIAGFVTGFAQQWQWAVSGSCSGLDRAWDIARTTDGSVFITGQFTDTLKIENSIAYSRGMEDVFVAKYNQSGVLQWLTTFGGKSTDIGIGIDADAAGNTYICGYFTDTLTINDSAYIAASWDMFFVKISPEGKIVWMQHPNSDGYELAYGVAVTAQGEAYITGWFQGKLIFETDTTLMAYGSSDILVAKFNTNGNLCWAKNAGTAAVDYGYKIGVDSAANCYVTGVADSACDFGNGVVLLSRGMFVTKYDKNGVAQATAAASAGVNQIAVAQNGAGYVSGRFKEYTQFGNNSILSFNKTDDAYCAKLDANCLWQWEVQSGGNGSDKGRAVAVDKWLNAYYTGSFADTFYIAGQTLIANNLSDDIFVAKVSSDGQYQWIMQAGSELEDVATDIITDSDGNIFVTGWYVGNSKFGNQSLQAQNVADMNFFLAKINIPAGIENNVQTAKNLYIKQFPNPFTNNVSFEIQTSNFNFQTTKIKIFNLLGNCVKEVTNCASRIITIDTNDLQAGFYFYTIENGNLKTSGKIVKK